MQTTKLNVFICCLLFFIAAACSISKHETIVKGHLNIPKNLAYTLFVEQKDSLISIQVDSTQQNFILRLTCDTPHFITLRGVMDIGDQQWPFSQPLFIVSGKNHLLELKSNNRQMLIVFDTKDKDNNALCAYERFYLDHNRELWTIPPRSEQVEEFLKAYIQKADSIIKQYHVIRQVAEYLSIHSYLDYLNGIESLRFIYQRDTNYKMPQNIKNTVSTPEKILDCPTALLFSSTINTIIENLEMTSSIPEEQIQQLQQKYTQPEIIQNVIRNILQNYLIHYDYTHNFDEGLARLERMCSFLPKERDQFIREYTAKKYSVEGAPLPTATIEDRNGKLYKLSDFQGKYLYIDLWASWCVPCCAEIPHLQELEKQITNKQVEFISISIDKNKNEWTNRMDKLQMKGHQFIATGDELTSMLNIQGIPHFLIYDKDGKLIQYKASAPSKGESLKKYLNELK
ncbi:MAG: TlpA disulfide reductase family protein [Odoribacter sp.]